VAKGDVTEGSPQHVPFCKCDLCAAQTAALLARARQFTAYAEVSEAALVTAKIEAEKAQRERAEELADLKYHHVYVFDEVVTDSSVERCMEELNVWHRLDPGCDMEIIFYSPGGSVLAGLALYDYLQGLRRAGHHLTTRALGMAASMAGILLQAGDKRIIGRESYVLIHEISAGAVGKIGEMEDEMKFLKKIQKRILDIFAARATVKRGYFATHWRRQDWWLDSGECLKIGFVDEVA